jgi:hypothetical protein
VVDEHIGMRPVLLSNNVLLNGFAQLYDLLSLSPSAPVIATLQYSTRLMNTLIHLHGYTSANTEVLD